ncbi:MAG: transposase [Chthoniobacterales bacterium]
MRRFPQQIERWLDALEGSCVMRQEKARRIVAKALSHFDGVRHQHHSWIVMPNHVHALVSICDGWSFENVVQSWKGFSAREINRSNEKGGTLWQKDYFDRIIRNERHFWRCARYIRQNPLNLPESDYSLWESEVVREHSTPAPIA